MTTNETEKMSLKSYQSIKVHDEENVDVILSEDSTTLTAHKKYRNALAVGVSVLALLVVALSSFKTSTSSTDFDMLGLVVQEKVGDGYCLDASGDEYKTSLKFRIIDNDDYRCANKCAQLNPTTYLVGYTTVEIPPIWPPMTFECYCWYDEQAYCDIPYSSDSLEASCATYLQGGTGPPANVKNFWGKAECWKFKY